MATGEWWSWSPATAELQAARGGAGAGLGRSCNRQRQKLQPANGGAGDNDFFAGRYGVRLSFNAHFLLEAAIYFVGSSNLFCWNTSFKAVNNFFLLEAVIFFGLKQQFVLLEPASSELQ